MEEYNPDAYINTEGFENRIITSNLVDETGSVSYYLFSGGTKIKFSGASAIPAYNFRNQGTINTTPITVAQQFIDSLPTVGTVMSDGFIQRISKYSNNISNMTPPSPSNQYNIEQRARQLANEMLRQMAQQNRKASSGRVFTRFDINSDILENQQVQVTSGLFTSNAATMSAAFTSSLQTSGSKNYYYEVWNSTAVNAEPQFSIAYGHRRGSGSSAAGTLNDSPTRAVYSQYRLLSLNPGDTQFTFGDGTSSDSIYAINFNRARLKDKIDPGNWQLTLAQLSGSSVPNNAHTGSNVKIISGSGITPRYISLIDDSGDTYNTGTIGTNLVYNIVSGSITGGIHNPSAPHYYGLMYPTLGIVILNDAKLNQSASFNSVTGSDIAGDNAWKLYTSISGAMSANSNFAIQARNIENITSTHYFVRVKNGEYNFSNNPTFVTGSGGDLAQPTFYLDPKTYITTVGMYNDSQELLAVAKLSQPIQKSFSIETLIKVKLDF